MAKQTRKVSKAREQDEIYQSLIKISNWLHLARITHYSSYISDCLMTSQEARTQTLKIKMACRELNSLHTSIICGKGRSK